MGRQRKRRISLTTRRTVLARCAFVCTVPGCVRIAQDLHHAVFESAGGSTEPDNLLGLCKVHHRWVHSAGGDPDGLLPPLEQGAVRARLAREMLASTIDALPLRTDTELRARVDQLILDSERQLIETFDGVGATLESGNRLAYEIFLRSALAYHQALGSSPGIAEAALRLGALYSNRGGTQAAANRMMALVFAEVGEAVDARAAAVRQRAMHLQAYRAFTHDPASARAEEAFALTAAHARAWGYEYRATYARGMSIAVRARRGEDVREPFEKLRDELADLEIDEPLWKRHALSWIEQNIPAHSAVASIVRTGAPSEPVLDLLGGLAATEMPGESLRNAFVGYLTALAEATEGDPASTVVALDRVRRAYYRDHEQEGLATVLVSLGDALVLAGDVPEALRMYRSARRQPGVLDNRHAVLAGAERMRRLRDDPAWRPERVFDQFSTGART